MAWQFNSVFTNPKVLRTAATFLTSLWGLLAAYLLCDMLLERHSLSACLAAFVPLAIVWAALERKRWGRLALLGLSSMTPVFLTLCLLIPGHADGLSAWQAAILPYGGIMVGSFLIILTLSTLLLLNLPAVVVEFEQGKRSTLAGAQHRIAVVMVGCWALALVVPHIAPRLFNGARQLTKNTHSLLIAPASALPPKRQQASHSLRRRD